MGVMTGWYEIVDLTGRLVAQQAPFARIMIGLGAAFAALMFVEGLRASFFPSRRHPSQRTPDHRAAQLPARTTAVSFRSLPSRARLAARPAAPSGRKRQSDAIKRHRPPRPEIRRHAAIDLPSAPSSAPSLQRDGVPQVGD